MLVPTHGGFVGALSPFPAPVVLTQLSMDHVCSAAPQLSFQSFLVLQLLLHRGFCACSAQFEGNAFKLTLLAAVSSSSVRDNFLLKRNNPKTQPKLGCEHLQWVFLRAALSVVSFSSYGLIIHDFRALVLIIK